MRQFATVVLFALTLSTIQAQPPERVLAGVKDDAPTGAAPPIAAEPLSELNTTQVTPTAPRIWASGEYVFWGIGTGKLVEMGKSAYNSDQFNALLDAAGQTWPGLARELLGDDRTGYRFNAGVWFDDAHTLGVEAGFLYMDRGPLVLELGKRDFNPLERLVPDGEITFERNRRLGIDGGRIDRPLLALLLLRKIGLPGILEGSRREVVIPYGDRDLVDGNVTIEIADQTFWMFDLTGRARMIESGTAHVDGLLGYRRVFYQDRMMVHSEVTTLARPLLPGTQLNSFDEIIAQTTYDGALIGADMEASCGPWSFALRASATVACLRSEVTRLGAKTATLPDKQRLDFAGGTYLRATDLGTYYTTSWTILPEVSLRVARSFCDNVRLLLGSSLLYLPQTARAAQQFDFGLDADRTIAGRPGTQQVQATDVPVLSSAFVATMSIGLELRY